jgi:phosphoglycerol transferase MdoB-like AlkP superfamily enzyme
VSDAFNPYASSKRRAWMALTLGVLGVATMPAAVILAQRSHTFAILDASYAVPLAFVLGLLATGMASRAKRNLAWLRIDEGGTGVASLAVILGVLALSLALMGALSVGFYEGLRYYQHHH